MDALFNITFPITDPTWIFFLVLCIILLAPIVLGKFNIPHIIGMIFAGVIVGEHGLNILARDSSFELFGQVGLFYIMFLAGLEMNMENFKSIRGKAVTLGLMAFIVPMVLGFLVGGLAGYFGGAFDFIAMRFVEFLMAIPSLYLLLAMRSALAPHFDSAQMYIMIVIILSALGWAGTARVIRGMSLSLANTQYVQAAKAMGESPVKIIVKHFLPNVLSYLIVAATLSIPAYVLGEAALSFLGLGIQEPSASWGLMLAQAQNDTKVLMLGFWWMLIPGIAIFATVLCFNILGDILRDIADPKKD